MYKEYKRRQALGEKGDIMVRHILGNYLEHAGKITKVQLQQVLQGMDQVHVKMGLLAIAEGYMTTGQAEEVNRLQAVEDKRFGDIAVESGYLTEEQVEKLLQKQGNEYMIFLQTLVDNNIATLEEAEGILREYQEYKGLSDAQTEAIKSGNIDRIVPVYLPKDAEGFGEIIGVAVRTIIRCVDRDVYLEEAQLEQVLNGKNGAFQTLEAEDGETMTVGLIEAEGGFLTAASLFAGEEFGQLDADALDSCAELLNCINGIYASAKSKNAVELELLPPQMHQMDVELTSGEIICKLPVMIKGRKLYFVVWK